MRKGGNEKMKNKFVLIRYVLMLWMLCGVCHTQSVASAATYTPQAASSWGYKPLHSVSASQVHVVGSGGGDPSSWRRVPHTHRRLILRMKMTLLVRSPPSLSANRLSSSSSPLCSSASATTAAATLNGAKFNAASRNSKKVISSGMIFFYEYLIENAAFRRLIRLSLNAQIRSFVQAQRPPLSA